MASHEQEIATFGQNDDFWLFGYGSLIWKPPPHFDQRVPGYIEGYVRRFWQDHRGTPEAPGRVATLIDKAHWETLNDHHGSTERVWGAAYHIPTSRVREVREYLDIREINGYSIQFTPFHPAPFTTSISSPPASPTAFPETLFNHRPSLSIKATTTVFAHPEMIPTGSVRCLVYIGLPENPQFLGPQDPDELARHILKSHGPSGDNKEYLYLLEKSLLELSRDSGDKHVTDLVRRCREFEALENGVIGEEADIEATEHVGVPLHKTGSTEEQEEVER
ncbi:ChaC-like protein [Polyplosphaeria fusca]|uniref:glutathione-specific gamma-glutamylcyclotransferase n=1 Tax=Polyplosphaeria fusca TaxID=682080 RepID=A0A9P4V3F6_9PLEO|nr:ChaC-like protein [Polyplosphaeria fusca]